jgi:hypothetical protein
MCWYLKRASYVLQNYNFPVRDDKGAWKPLSQKWRFVILFIGSSSVFLLLTLLPLMLLNTEHFIMLQARTKLSKDLTYRLVHCLFASSSRRELIMPSSSSSYSLGNPQETKTNLADEWEKRKGILHELYMKQNLTLHEVTHIMAREHKFTMS